MAYKYGKLPPKPHLKTLLLRDYLPKGGLPTPEAKRAWEYVVSDAAWGQSMLGNDMYGDCVIAMMLHYIMAASANTHQRVTFTTQQALDLYSAITGFDPSNLDTDQGTVITDALNYWQTTGCYGHKILGWAALDPSNLDQIKQGISIFGGVLIGTTVTQSMEDDFAAGKPWNTFTGNILGGHGIPWLGFGRLGQTCITWAKRQQMSPEALSQVDEAYVVVTQDWLDAQGQSPSGLDLAALQADLQAISTNS